MLVDATLPSVPLKQIPSIAQAADKLGFDALWASETQHDPFLPGALIAEHTQRIHFGTAVAIAFARSPATMAYTAWDLAQASGGRFILGLGTQVKAHIERRFGMPWPASVVGKFREQITSVRAFWQVWQNHQRLNVRGEYYKLTLMSPFFDPGPIDHPEIPIYIAGVNIGLAKLAGEVADGFHIHPFHSVRYVREVIIPAIEKGALESGRSLDEVTLSTTAFVIPSPDDEAFVRSQVAFYASTPSYRAVMQLHGWGEIAERLSKHAARAEWDAMPGLIDEDMLDAFAIKASPQDLADALCEKYDGLVDRVALYIPFIPGQRDEFWRRVLKARR